MIQLLVKCTNQIRTKQNDKRIKTVHIVGSFVCREFRGEKNVQIFCHRKTKIELIEKAITTNFCVCCVLCAVCAQNENAKKLCWDNRMNLFHFIVTGTYTSNSRCFRNTIFASLFHRHLHRGCRFSSLYTTHICCTVLYCSI